MNPQSSLILLATLPGYGDVNRSSICVASDTSNKPRFFNSVDNHCHAGSRHPLFRCKCHHQLRSCFEENSQDSELCQRQSGLGEVSLDEFIPSPKTIC